MKTFMLSAFALCLLLSVTAFADDDYWVKTDFPDKEIKQMTGSRSETHVALTTDNEVYILEYQYNGGYSWTKIDFDETEKINAVSDNYFGTDKGLYQTNYSWENINKVDLFQGKNILDIYTDYESQNFPFVKTTDGLYTFNHSELIECNMPEEDSEICEMAFNNNSLLALTQNGELFFSYDNSQTWSKAVENPEGHLFTAVKWDSRGDKFIVGSDKGLFYLTDQLEEVQNFDGGYVNCIAVLEIYFVCEQGSKKDKALFNPIQSEDRIVVGTQSKGVYGITENGEIKQKNDSLKDLNIVDFSYDRSGEYVMVGTNSDGIYKTKLKLGGSVDELNLTPYVLKITPNPAKTTASITFHNPEYAKIEISIYDLFGRKVADVHSGNLAEGDYNFSADLSGLASGSYFLRFGVGGRVGAASLIVE